MTGFVDVSRGSGEPRKFMLVSFHVFVCFIFLIFLFTYDTFLQMDRSIVKVNQAMFLS